MPDLTGKRVLILGAETEIGRAVTTAVAEAGASVAAVAEKNDAEAAFAVQRLARQLSSGERKVIAQAIDATNEAAVRVMVRQVSKELGGIDAAVDAAEHSHEDVMLPGVRAPASAVFFGYVSREQFRAGGGIFVSFLPVPPTSGSYVTVGVKRKPREGPVVAETPRDPLPSLRAITIETAGKTPERIATEVVHAIAGEPHSG